MARNLKAYPTGENIENVLVQTLIGRVKLESEISLDDLPLYYKAQRQYWIVVHRKYGKYIDFSHMELSSKDLARATYIMKGQQQAAYGRRFFTTKNGYMGLSLQAPRSVLNSTPQLRPPPSHTGPRSNLKLGRT